MKSCQTKCINIALMIIKTGSNELLLLKLLFFLKERLLVSVVGGKAKAS